MHPQTKQIPANVGPAALRTFFNILEQWQLSPAEGQSLLGVPESTYFRWKKQPNSANVDSDKLERMSYIFGIYKALRLLYSDEGIADGWLCRNNENPLFNGQKPLQRLLSGQVADLYVIRQHLDARRGMV
ncbi:MAG: MbcA/ParS/Xre antitoxin family protein [Gammaproteobacteria bacterium]|nr:MbcA/ParS/Xre antitoxin family protein [Gammaproteobacteria bacterium]MDH5799681.1 MbcA/ParS/Xre antitoxin family protein [Gammaproteobacteria bacterium]